MGSSINLVKCINACCFHKLLSPHNMATTSNISEAISSSPNFREVDGDTIVGKRYNCFRFCSFFSPRLLHFSLVTFLFLPRLISLITTVLFLGACKTYFETVRRSYRYSQPGLSERAEAAKLSAKSRARRKRVRLA